MTLKALLIEDDDDQRATIAAILESAGFECTAVSSGASGIGALTHTRFDLVACDWKMKGISEADLIYALNATPHGLAAKIIVITGAVGEDDQLVEAFRAGVDDVYRKSMGNTMIAAKFRSLALKMATEAKVVHRLSELEQSMVDHIGKIESCSAEKDEKIKELSQAIVAMQDTLDAIKVNTDQTAEMLRAYNQAKAFTGSVRTVFSVIWAYKKQVAFFTAFAYAIAAYLKTGVWVPPQFK